MDVNNAYLAETWKELFNAEAVAVRIVPPLGIGPDLAPREIWVPDAKTHVAREILRKI
jgi:hypothetical protein